MKLYLIWSSSCESAGSGSSDDNERHQQVTPICSTSGNSVIVVGSIPNLGPEQGAYPHLRNFSYNDLRLATRNFKREHFLGEGRFGRVFKGWLSEDAMTPTRPGIGMPVAVKILNQDGLQGHREWLVWNLLILNTLFFTRKRNIICITLSDISLKYWLRVCLNFSLHQYLRDTSWYSFKDVLKKIQITSLYWKILRCSRS